MIFKVRRAQRGDAEAFISLMEEYKITMQRVAFGFFKNEEDVADVIQDTMLYSFENIKKLQQAKYFKTWLIRILINNCNQLYNRNKKYTAMEHLPEEIIWDTPHGDDDFYELLSKLEEDSRVMFQLYYGEEFTTKEIAAILKVNENTIKSKLHRGRKQLRAILDDDNNRNADDMSAAKEVPCEAKLF